jgi:hypothetical protein
VSADDPASGSREESADFAATRVGGARRRPSIVALAWFGVLSAVVILGVSGRLPGFGDSSAGAGAGASATAAQALAQGTARVARRTAPPRFEPDMMAIETSAPGPIQLEATRQPSSVFVHGDVFAKRITWIFVALQSLDGQVGGWASVSVPGSASAATGSNAPAMRFDVELAVPTALSTGVLVVQANAYDASGALVGSTRVRLAPQM